ncbi:MULTISPECIES: GvpL/GvpF family gas vesicle protein [Frankia]|uniref:Gas vesicle protein L n=2 Tax=Frankia TaxID=1854 RepID=Q0RLD9_FRAAA|nr:MULTISPECIES: GvpL/GvpF family gas vesicle protein [Frankia]CAJ61666.1 Gas vesicle protein L [Frankia alni ACN14a]
MPAASDADSLAALARQLAPGVLEEAVSEARSVARRQLAQRLAQEITRVVFDAGVPGLAQGWTGLAEGLWGEGLPGEAPPGPDEGLPGERGLVREAEVPTDDRVSDDRVSGDLAVPGGEGTAAASTGGSRGRGCGVDVDHGLYAYGIVPEQSRHVSDLEGLVAGTGVRAVVRPPVALVVSDIELALLRDLEQDVSETGRLADLARRHDQVLRALAERGGVLPLRFGTVLPDAEQAYAVLDDPEQTLSRTLAQVQDTREWGLRVDAPQPVADAAPLDQPIDPPVEVAGLAPGSGTAYLTARRREIRAQEARREELGTLIEQADEELTAFARDTARRRGGRAGRMFDCAYLVPRLADEEFLAAARTLVRRLTQAGLDAEITGPWPPYSFVHVTLGGGGDGGGADGGGADGGGADG